MSFVVVVTDAELLPLFALGARESQIDAEAVRDVIRLEGRRAFVVPLREPNALDVHGAALAEELLP